MSVPKVVEGHRLKLFPPITREGSQEAHQSRCPRSTPKIRRMQKAAFTTGEYEVARRSDL
jgi:hypothetical protein